MMHPTAQTNTEAPTWICALKKLGYTGPLTINAIGRLTEVSEDALRAVYSTGIGLNHVSTDNGFDLDLILWGWNHPTPANVLLISDYRIFGCTLGTLQARGYNVISPTYFASASVSPFDYIPVWQSLLAMLRAGVNLRGRWEISAVKNLSWFVQHAMKTSDFESFITHLKSTEHARDEEDAEAEASTIQKIPTCSRAGMMIHPKAPTNAEAEAQTRVWWDITRCPVPSDVDARMVGPWIKKALKKLGYTGPLTITAIGILTEVPLDVLRAIYSSGIALRHVPKDESGIRNYLFSWGLKNPSPINCMLLSGERTFGSTLASLERKGNNIIRSLLSYDTNEVDSALNLTFTLEGCFFLWHSLLAMLRAGELEEEEDKCSETGEPALVCSTCDGKVDYVKDFESFITHLYSKEHGLKELQFYRHCGSYEKEDATTIRHVLACFRAGIRSCQRKAEEELKAGDELKAQHVEHKKSRKR
ncbi:unnamed protein product [Eruca vesicaria subsp. sativa]|uniref:NYN domain-containing protein n=1 Tax=Eruca vesicaria subsp. sativa TaxID=29727 RepID=A0ABC8LKS3_ERUVS|nr:unnamed protein product [Eruca vesicaria subsp. sativa]